MDVVYNLINVKRFSDYTYDEKLELKRQGKPMPDMNIEKNSSSRGKAYKRHCNTQAVYSKNDWICGCNRKKAFFCFPCLLYAVHPSIWTKEGVNDLTHLNANITRHENSQGHIASAIEWTLLGNSGLTSRLDSTGQQKSEGMIEHRYVLSKIVDAIKSCKAFDVSLQGLDKAGTSRYPGMYRGLINLSSALDEVITGQYQNMPLFRGTSKDIQNDLLNCILEICQEETINQINKSMFLAIAVDDTKDISEKQQLAVVFRYTYNNIPVERFWKYLSPATADARSITADILNDLERLLESDNTFKLISQSYNGTAVLLTDGSTSTN